MGVYHRGGTDRAQRVTARLVGYAPQTVPAMVTDGENTNVSIAMSHSAVSLSQVVVTATRAERTRQIGSSVSVLDVTKERVPLANTQELLTGRVSGVTVLANSGQAGAGGAIRLRGVNSISQGNAPIIYVDGVRISDANPPVSGEGHGNTNPLNDINMADVERVEIVKGPAATTLYGTEASGGVIQLFTKRGQRGGTQATTDVSVGFNNMGHIGASSDSTGMFVNQCSGILQLGNGTRFQDPTCPRSGSWLSNGLVQRYALSVGIDRSQRLLPVRQFQRRVSSCAADRIARAGARNTTIRLNPRLSIALNSSFVRRYVRWFRMA